MWEKLKRPKSVTFSFFRRSRHRQITPSRLSTPRSVRTSSDNEHMFLVDNLEKQNTKDSLISNGSDLQDTANSTSGIQTDIGTIDLPDVNRPYSVISAPARIMRPKTAESLFASDGTLDEVCEGLSIYSDIFLPEHWLFQDDEYVDKCWKTGSRLQMTKVKNKVKSWLANDTNAFPLK